MVATEHKTEEKMDNEMENGMSLCQKSRYASTVPVCRKDAKACWSFSQ